MIGRCGLLIALLILLTVGIAHAVLIDFESGFSDQQMITGSISGVTFGVGTNSATGNAYIARAGGRTTAFKPGDVIPSGVAGGDFFLTDEFDGPRKKLNYFLTFENTVRNLKLDLYDYRNDGGPRIGDSATLYIYSDNYITEIGSDVYVIPRGTTDSNLAQFDLSGYSGIKSAALMFDRPDVGTGIDNISFETNPVPEPSTLLLLGLGLLGLFGYGKRSRKG